METIYYAYCTSTFCHQDKTQQPSSLGTLILMKNIRSPSSCPRCSHALFWTKNQRKYDNRFNSSHSHNRNQFKI